MTKLSTAAVLVSGKGFGPFGQPGWRVAAWLELVEGGGAGPFVLCQAVDNPDASERSVVLMSDDTPETVSNALLTATAHTSGDENCRRLLEGIPSHTGAGGETVFEDASQIPKTVNLELAKELASQYRLGIIRLEADTIITDDAVSLLEKVGLQTDIFDPRS